MRKKLVLLSAFLSPYRSGAEAMVEEVALRLPEEFDVTIVTARLSRALPTRDMLQGKVPVLRVGLGFGFDKYLFPLLAPIAARKLRPQIIHAVLESYAGMALVVSRWLVPSARRVLTLQSTNTALLLGPMHRSAHVITAISRTLITRAAHFGRKDVILIPNGIDYQATRGASGQHAKIRGRVLFVGRLERMKGVDVLLRAFAGIGDRDTSLHIVGDGSLRAELEGLASSLRIQDRVTFLGRLTGDALLREYAEAEVFVGLSRSEALGNVFLEAQAAGCAVVATTVGGIPEIVSDGSTGILVPPDHPKDAQIVMEKFLGDRVLLQAMGARGITTSAEYDWQLITTKYRQVLLAAIG